MSFLPRPQVKERAPRAHLKGITPTVLRLADGRQISGKLHVVSITGGLLHLPRPVEQGSKAKLMFLTSSGSVFGITEMLSPVSWGLQPFRFVRLYAGDQDRLNAAIHSSLEQSRRDLKHNRRAHAEIEKHRAW